MTQDKRAYYREYYKKNRERLIKKNIENTKKRKQEEKDGKRMKGMKITRGNFVVSFK